jgi:quercetin dioxygenase-like cupin family protein
MAEVIIRRAGESEKTFDIEGIPLHLLVKTDLLEGTLIEIEAGKGIPKKYSHEGEEIRIILDGALEVEVSGKKYLLSKGDCMWFKSDQPHTVRNTGEKKAVFFSVTVPPSFKW